MTLAKVLRLSLSIFLLGAPLLLAGDEDPPRHKRPYFGIRFDYNTLPFFHTGVAASSTSVPAADYWYSATSHTPRFTVAPTVEFRLPHRLSLAAELDFRHLAYQQNTLIQSGTFTYPDNRNTISIQQTAKINAWEVPILARYTGFRARGWFSRVYLTGGLAYRHFGRIRSGTQYQYPDGSTDYNENAPVPSLVNQIGAVGGLGLRLKAPFDVLFIPEVRYTRWRGVALQGTAFNSTANQLEGGIGFSF